MKVIDKTPFQNEKGQAGILQRMQGIMEHGAAWNAEVEAQKAVIPQLERVLEKGYTLIRNLGLQNSKIILPLILVGPPGVFVLYVTSVSGHFEAKGDEWNVINKDRRVPASSNLLTRATRLARATQVYLNRQGVYLPGVVEPVLIAASPGVHIESLRPIVRVVLSDGIKQFGASLVQARPLLRSDLIHEVVDHLVNPHRKTSTLEVGAPPPEPEPVATVSDVTVQAPDRARAIFHAAEETKPFDAADLEFQFNERGGAAGSASQQAGAAPTRGLRPRQILVLVALMLIELGVLAGFAYLLLFGSR
jgi:hypothetical protein